MVGRPPGRHLLEEQEEHEQQEACSPQLALLPVGQREQPGLLAGAHYLQIEAFRYAEAVAIVPYRYSSLVWAMLLGFFVWGQLPDALVLIGATGIVASGLYIWHRERRRAGGISIPGAKRG